MTINSFYIKIPRIKYRAQEYIKCDVQYFSKASNVLIIEEKNVKIMRDKMKHWEIWND